MRRWAIASLLLLGLFLVGVEPGNSNEKQKEEPGPFTIEYHGQSFYIITTTKGKRIAFDPHTIPVYHPSGLIPAQKADVVCVSHFHTDHIRTEIFDLKKN